MTEKETTIQNKIAQEEKKIEQYEKRIEQYEKRIKQLKMRKQLELSREIKKEEKKKISDQIFIGKTLLEKSEKREISIADMNEVLNLIFKQNNEKREEFIAILNRY